MVSKQETEDEVVVWTASGLLADVRLVSLVLCIGAIMVAAIRNLLR